MNMAFILNDIRTRADKLSLNRYQLARAAGLDTQALRDMASETWNPKAATVEALLDALNRMESIQAAE